MAKYEPINYSVVIETMGRDEDKKPITMEKSICVPDGYTPAAYAEMLQVAVNRCGKHAADVRLHSAMTARDTAARKLSKDYSISAQEEYDKKCAAVEDAEQVVAFWENKDGTGETSHFCFLAVIAHKLVKFNPAVSPAERYLFNACKRYSKLSKAENADPAEVSKALETVKQEMLTCFADAGIKLQKISRGKAVQFAHEVGNHINERNGGMIDEEVSKNSALMYTFAKTVLWHAGVRVEKVSTAKKDEYSF